MGKKILKGILSILIFILNNILYWAWFVIYVFLTIEALMWLTNNNALSFLITAFSYSISLILLFTPIGEFLLRFINGVRKLHTEREKDYLIPLFEDVYDEAKKIYPRLSKKIRICIVDAMYINAFALGRKTVAVTTGAVESLSEDELKGFISHEIGHIRTGDTMALMFISIGNGIFSLFTMVLQKILYTLENDFYVHGFLFWIIKTIIRILLIYFKYLFEITLSINSRINEYRADKFAYKTGHGDNLKNSLYLLQRMVISDKSKLVDKLKKSHPSIAKRIGKLEKMLNNEQR